MSDALTCYVTFVCSPIALDTNKQGHGCYPIVSILLILAKEVKELPAFSISWCLKACKAICDLHYESDLVIK